MPGFLSRRSREMDPHLQRGGKNGALLELCWDPRCSSPVEMGMSRIFLSCTKSVKDPFKAQEGRWDFSRDDEREKSLISCSGKNLLVFLSSGRKFGVPLGLRQGPQGPICIASGNSSLHVSYEGPLEIPFQSLPGRGPHLVMRLELQRSSPVLTMTSGFLWSFHRGVRPCLMWRHASPLFLEVCKQCQVSCQVDIGIGGFLSRYHRAVTPAIIF